MSIKQSKCSSLSEFSFKGRKLQKYEPKAKKHSLDKYACRNFNVQRHQWVHNLQMLYYKQNCCETMIYNGSFYTSQVREIR